MGNALLNAADLLVFLRVDTFVSTLFSKACVYFHNYSLRCYLKISKRCGDSYISRRKEKNVRKEKKAIRFQRFFFSPRFETSNELEQFVLFVFLSLEKVSKSFPTMIS